MTMSTCRRPISAVQSLFKTLTQISPDFETLGWNILVVKKPLGGTLGKSLHRASFILNKPPAYGVPVGPSMST